MAIERRADKRSFPSARSEKYRPDLSFRNSLMGRDDVSGGTAEGRGCLPIRTLSSEERRRAKGPGVVKKEDKRCQLVVTWDAISQRV
jgi:hypothetical protein